MVVLQLEQMELEVKDLPLKDRQKYNTRVKSYKAELSKLQTDNVGVYRNAQLEYILRKFARFWFSKTRSLFYYTTYDYDHNLS
jgi:hypothetical protein